MEREIGFGKDNEQKGEVCRERKRVSVVTGKEGKEEGGKEGQREKERWIERKKDHKG